MKIWIGQDHNMKRFVSAKTKKGCEKAMIDMLEKWRLENAPEEPVWTMGEMRRECSFKRIEHLDQ